MAQYDPASREAIEAAKAAQQNSGRLWFGDLQRAEREARYNNSGTLPTPTDPVGTADERRKVREYAGWTTADVVRATGLPIATVEGFERDDGPDPSRSVLAGAYRLWLKSVVNAANSGVTTFDEVHANDGSAVYTDWDPSVSAEVNQSRRAGRA